MNMNTFKKAIIMNKKNTITLFLALAAINVHAQFLFRINGKQLKEPSYILGSVHTLPGSILDTIPEYLEAEAKCKQLFAEYDISDQQRIKDVQAAGQQAITLPDGKTIFDVMNKDQIETLNTRFRETFQVNLTDSVMKTIWNYQPTVLISSFNLAITLQEMQKNPELAMTGMPIDMVCINRAKERGLKIGQLDEIQSEDSLTKMRNTMNENLTVQIDSLMAYLNDFDQRKQKTIDEINYAALSAKLWKTGDYDSFAKSEFWMTETEKQSALFRLRNERWLPELQAAMGEMPTMFVFGAGHLIGNYGILQLLRNAGYHVEQIKRQ